MPGIYVCELVLIRISVKLFGKRCR